MSMHERPADVGPDILRAYDLTNAVLVPIESGHINRTFEVRDGSHRFVLQWLNPIFSPEIHRDIEVITARLSAAGVQTPRLVRTADGELWTTDARGNAWRLLTFVPGMVFLHITSAHQCHEAGALAARFHGALRDMDHVFHSRRLGVHDTAGHLARLQETLSEHRHHRAYDRVAPLASEIISALGDLPDLSALPEQIAHGDMKASNIVFNEEGTRARAFVDLDTLAPMPLAIELGDALRSWCADGGEDREDARFVAEHFEAALAGYATAGPDLLSPYERDVLVFAVETICLELAARFATDALRESYFAWDPRRFDAPWQHHLSRTRSQLSVWRSLHSQRDCLLRVAELILRDPKSAHGSMAAGRGRSG